MARRALGPATLAVVQAVDGALTDTDVRLLVACSGGADSLALAAATRVVAERRSLTCAAVVVDHRLQAGSDTVAEQAAAVLRGLGVSAVEVVPVTAGATGSPEAAARDARYAALRAAAGTPPATILLGHTRDDQAETVLLGLARGSGPRSLAGMAVRSAGLLRPLLDLPRTTTEQACRELGLEPWADPHNDDPRFARVRVRHRVLPVLEEALGPGVAAALARTARLLRDDADLLDALAQEADPGPEPDCARLAALPAALRSRVLRRWLVPRAAGDVGADHVRAVEALVLAWHGQRGVDLPGGTVARREGRLLWQAVARG